MATHKCTYDDIFEFEVGRFDRFHFYDNCTFLRNLGKYKKGDEVKRISVYEGIIWIDGTDEHFVQDSWKGFP